jgi:hypothetical protein
VEKTINKSIDAHLEDFKGKTRPAHKAALIGFSCYLYRTTPSQMIMKELFAAS